MLSKYANPISYQKYISSSQWKKLRREVISLAGFRCILCGSKHNLVVHHLRYPKILGEETLDMLQCLCENCHNVKCHGGNPSKAKKRLTKLQKALKRQRKKRAKFAGPIKVYTKKEIQEYIKNQPITPERL